MRSPLRAASASSLAFVLLASLAAAPGCGDAVDKSGPSTLKDSGGGGGDDTSIGPDDDSGIVLDDSGGGQIDTKLDPDAACAASHTSGQRIPPNILLVFDHSGSMSTSETGGTRWAQATTAIAQFLNKVPTDLKFGLKLFEAVSGDTCKAATYAKPDVAIDTITNTGKPILCWIGKATGCAGITAASPSGLTPMMYAEQGAVQYMKAFTGEGAKVIILVTDGTPEDSCTPTSDVAGVVAAAANGKANSVRTFVIGVPGGDVPALSQVAHAGGGDRIAGCNPTASTANGTECHYQMKSGTTTLTADLIKALDDITGKALTCTFKVPASSGDAGVDLASVNVDLTTSTGTQSLARDTTHANGWDYTDGNTTITLYGPACDTVLKDGTAKVDILLGCPTITPQ
jgi:hypothetical protein